MTTTRAEVAAEGSELLSNQDEGVRLSVSLRARRILVDTGTLLATSLELEATLRRVSGLTVPALADLCLIDLFTPGENGGEVRRVQAFHQLAELPAGSQPLKINELEADNPVVVALRTEKAVLIRDLDDQGFVRTVAGTAADKVHLTELRAANVHSLICVPLIGRERIIGTLTLGSKGHYEAADVEVVEEVAQRAAWALDNALVHETAQQARQRSEEARAAADAVNRLKDNFLVTLSHELRTPMAALMLWERILRTAKDDSMRLRALDAIHQSALAQSKLIEDLLDVSRCMSGKLLIESRVVSIPSVIENALEAALPIAGAKGVRLVNSCHRALGCVLGDASRLRQVMGNLLSNAIKFTDRGGLVEVHGERVGANIEISVTDTGCGISPDFLSEVFKPFHQAPSGLPRTQVGLGLGLAIVRQLVEMHDGTVRAASAGIGRGTTFVVALPSLGARPPAAITVTPERQDQPETPPPAMDTRPLRGMRILVVDDEPAVLDALALVLRAEGSHVAKTRSALQALAALRRGRWDVVVSDIAMPGADGYSLVRRLRMLTTDGGRRLPAIALTAHARPQDELRAIEAGFDVHLPKPIEAQDLVHTIIRIVSASSHSGS